MPLQQYTPLLAHLISFRSLPSGLGFLDDVLNTVFSKLYFKDLIAVNDHLAAYPQIQVPPSTPAGFLSVDNTIHASTTLIGLFFRSPEKGVIYLDHQFDVLPQ
jgi:hypothetical protein